MPFSAKPKQGVSLFPVDKEDLVPLDMKGVWEAMEECKMLGLTKAIGVSNFTEKKLELLLATAKIPPAVNQVSMHGTQMRRGYSLTHKSDLTFQFFGQVEMNPVCQQAKLREYCNEKGIHVTAYSPLGGAAGPNNTNLVMDSVVLKDIADARKKTVAQVPHLPS